MLEANDLDWVCLTFNPVFIVPELEKNETHDLKLKIPRKDEPFL